MVHEIEHALPHHRDDAEHPHAPLGEEAQLGAVVRTQLQDGGVRVQAEPGDDSVAEPAAVLDQARRRGGGVTVAAERPGAGDDVEQLDQPTAGTAHQFEREAVLPAGRLGAVGHVGGRRRRPERDDGSQFTGRADQATVLCTHRSTSFHRTRWTRQTYRRRT